MKHESIDATYKDGILNIHIPKKKGDARWLTKLFP
ncbi:MAG: Hsp20/alpha crystallin family protein [Bacteroidetes bacterium]|nr:Hsp20/alpha crystallin family protein [Bacteroidota bacterium]